MVATYTTIDIDRCAALTEELMNAARAVYGVVDDPLHHLTAFTDACKTCDVIVYDSIIQNLNHHLRRAFLIEKTGIMSGDIITDMPEGRVLIDVSGTFMEGTMAEPDEIQRYKRKLATSIATGTIKSLLGYYCWFGSALVFTGASAKIDVIPAVPPAFPISPVNYEKTVVDGMASLLFLKEGRYVEAANKCSSDWKTGLELIRTITQDKSQGGGAAVPFVYGFGRN